jgi:hypothetical protein
MAFLVYRRRLENGQDVLEATGEHFSLAGYNLIYAAWEKKGKPIRQGWQVSANDLIELYSEGKASYDTLRLIIDYHPNSKERIVLSSCSTFISILGMVAHLMQPRGRR